MGLVPPLSPSENSIVSILHGKYCKMFQIYTPIKKDKHLVSSTECWLEMNLTDYEKAIFNEKSYEKQYNFCSTVIIMLYTCHFNTFRFLILNLYTFNTSKIVFILERSLKYCHVSCYLRRGWLISLWWLRQNLCVSWTLRSENA